MPTAADVFQIVPSLIDDPEQDSVTNEAMTPFLQMAVDELMDDLLSNPNISKFKTYVEIPGLPIGTQSMAAAGYFKPGKELELLEEVEWMWEKLAGDQPYNYSGPMGRVQFLPIRPQDNFNGCYLPLSDDIQFVGAKQALDLRIFASFKPGKIKDQDSPIPPQTAGILRYKTAYLYCAARGNPALKQEWKEKAVERTDSLINSIIMQQQSVRIRQKPFVISLDNWGPALYP